MRACTRLLLFFFTLSPSVAWSAETVTYTYDADWMRASQQATEIRFYILIEMMTANIMVVTRVYPAVKRLTQTLDVRSPTALKEVALPSEDLAAVVKVRRKIATAPIFRVV